MAEETLSEMVKRMAEENNSDINKSPNFTATANTAAADAAKKQQQERDKQEKEKQDKEKNKQKDSSNSSSESKDHKLKPITDKDKPATDLASLADPGRVEGDDREGLLGQQEDILKEYDGQVGNIPLSSDYWSLGNKIRSLPERKKK